MNLDKRSPKNQIATAILLIFVGISFGWLLSTIYIPLGGIAMVLSFILSGLQIRMYLNSKKRSKKSS